MIHVFVVNELNLWRALALRLAGRRVYHAEVEPFLRLASPLLRPVVRLLDRIGVLPHVRRLDEAARWLDGKAGDGFLNDAYPRLADALDDLVTRRLALPAGDENRYAALKACSFHAHWLLELVYLTDWLERMPGGGNWCLEGVPAEFAEVHALVHGRPPAFPVRPLRWRGLANRVNHVTLLAYAALWLLSRLRRSVAREHHALCLDGWQPRDTEYLGDIGERPALIFLRNRFHAERDRDRWAAHPTCFKEDGRVTLRQALDVWRRFASGARALGRATAGCDPRLAYAVDVVAVKRLIFAVFFNRFRIDWFWGRDDYAVDHILRNEEARKVGGRSVGINHGLPIKIWDVAWRQIDFDLYYVYGRHIYDAYYSRHWPAHMVVKAVGTPWMSPDHLARLHGMRSRDIVFFVNPRRENPFLFAEMAKVARHFPDRQVLVKIKPSRRRDGSCGDEVELARQGPANMVETVEDSYRLMLSAGYAVSAGSTVCAEAVQYRVASFAFDVDGIGAFFYFRDFPAMCVSSGDDIIRRIEAIEAGREAYPFDALAPLIDQSGRSLREVIRADLGLPFRTEVGYKEPASDRAL